MDNLTAWVDVAIGLTLVYLGASLFVTVLNEYIAQTLNLRGKQLYDSLKTLISDKDVKAILMKSPALRPFFDTNRNKASSYLDPNILARLLVGGLVDPSVVGDTVKQVSGAIEKLRFQVRVLQLLYGRRNLFDGVPNYGGVYEASDQQPREYIGIQIG